MTRDEALEKAFQYREWAAVLGEDKVTTGALLAEAKRLEEWAKAIEESEE